MAVRSCYALRRTETALIAVSDDYRDNIPLKESKARRAISVPLIRYSVEES